MTKTLTRVEIAALHFVVPQFSRQMEPETAYAMLEPQVVIRRVMDRETQRASYSIASLHPVDDGELLHRFAPAVAGDWQPVTVR